MMNFFEAIRAGDTDRIEFYLAHGVDVNQKINDQQPIMVCIHALLKEDDLDRQAIRFSHIERLLEVGAVFDHMVLLDELITMLKPEEEKVRTPCSKFLRKKRPLLSATDIIKLFKLLYEHSENIEDKRQTCLMKALSVGQNADEIARYLLTDSINLGSTDSDHSTALHAACSSLDPSLEMVERLLDRSDIDINAKSKSGRTALDLCYIRPRFKLKIIALLLSRGGKTNHHDNMTYTNLLNCFREAQKQRLGDLTMLLIKEQELIKLRDYRGYGALSYVEDVETAKALFEAGAITYNNTNDFTPLLSVFQRILASKDEAYITQQFALLDYFEEQGAPYRAANDKGSVLHQMMRDSNHDYTEQLIQYVLDKGAPITARNAKGETVLHLAFSHWRVGVQAAKYLAEQAPALIDMPDAQGQLPVENIRYVKPSEIEWLETLLERFKLERAPKNLGNLIEMALSHTSLSLLERCMSFLRRFPDALDNLESPISSRKKITLMEDARDPSAPDLLCCILNTPEALKKETPQSMMNALCMAVRSQDLDMVKAIVESKQIPHLNGVNEQGQTLIESLFSAYHSQRDCEKDIAILEYLIPLGLDIHQRTSDNLHPIEKCFDDHSDNDFLNAYLLIRCFLDSGVKLTEPNKMRSLLLWASVVYRDEEAIKALLEEANSEREADLAFVARHAFSIDYFDFFPFLFEMGLEMNRPLYYVGYNNAQIPLLEALLYTLNHLSSELEKEKKEKEKKEKEKKEKEEAILTLIEFLIDRGVNWHFPTSVIPSAFTEAMACLPLPFLEKKLFSDKVSFPIHLAVYKRNIKYLPLTLAVESNNLPLVKLLLAKGADRHLRLWDGDGQTLLKLAVSKGFLDISEVLLKAGVSVNASYPQINLWGNEDKTALQIAITLKDLNAKESLVNLLYQYDVTVSGTDLQLAIYYQASLTIVLKIVEKLGHDLVLAEKPLLLALSVSSIELARYFLEKYGHAALSCRDNLGRTPLHFTTIPGNEVLFPELVAAGADPSAVDYLGRSINYYAICYGTWTDCNMTPEVNFSLESFLTLKVKLEMAEEIPGFSETARLFNLGEYAYKLMALFESIESALHYISKCRESAIRILHNICLFRLPSENNWDRARWAELVFQYGAEVTEYLHLAHSIEAYLGRVPVNLDEVKKAKCSLIYERRNDHEALAKVFSLYGIEELIFNRILDSYVPKESDRLPDLMIDGATLAEPHYYFCKLPPNDLRGFVLGAMTHCCQSVGSAGEPCAIHGMTSPYGGFYVLYKRGNQAELERIDRLLGLLENKTDFKDFLNALPNKQQRQKYQNWYGSLNDKSAGDPIVALKEALMDERNGLEQIVAQSWAWISESGSVVFDSWERLRLEDDRLCGKFLKAAAEKMVNEYEFRRVLLGQSGQTPRNLGLSDCETPEVPKDYRGYRDSMNQWLLAERESLIVSNDPDCHRARLFQPARPGIVLDDTPEAIKADLKSQGKNILIKQYSEPLERMRGPESKKMLDEKFDELFPRNLAESQLTLIGKKSGGYAALLIEVHHMKEDRKAYQVVYLDGLAERIDWDLEDYIKLRYQSAFCQNNVAYCQSPSQRGSWLKAVLSDYWGKGFFLTDVSIPSVEVEEAPSNVANIM